MDKQKVFLEKKLLYCGGKNRLVFVCLGWVGDAAGGVHEADGAGQEGQGARRHLRPAQGGRRGNGHEQTPVGGQGRAYNLKCVSIFCVIYLSYQMSWNEF